MHKVMLLNPKGGSGKTTLATTLASYYAANHYPTVLIDHDGQGSSTRWLGARPERAPAIHGVAAFRNPVGVTRSWHLRLPPGTERVVVDTPASIRDPHLSDLVRGTDSILIPVLPSHIDIDAAADFVQTLLHIQQVRSGATRVGVVANRVRSRTAALVQLQGFLEGLRFPLVTRLRDTQNYVRAGKLGVGIHELGGARTLRDREQWATLLAWVEQREREEFTPRGSPVAGGDHAWALPT